MFRSEAFRCTFTHPLSEHYQSRNTHPASVDRTDRESSAIGSVEKLLQELISEQGIDAAAFFFEEAGKVTYGATSSLRKCGIGMNKDARGGQVIFMPPSDLPKALEKLWIYIKAHLGNQPDLFAAVVASIGLLNAHPLEDGNGRLSRVLMNIFFRCNALNYVPLYDFHSNSSGGFIIRLRKAELFEEWDEIVQFYCNVIFAMAEQDGFRANGFAEQ